MNPVINYFNQLIFKFLPETKCFGFKRFLLRNAGIVVGDNVRVCSSVTIIGNGSIIFHDNIWIGPKSFLSANAQSKIEIFENCDLGPMVYIGTGTHEIDSFGEHTAGQGYCENIIIEAGVWLGARSTILPGVVIGGKSMIAAGAVVQNDVSPRSIYGGVPAKLIRCI